MTSKARPLVAALAGLALVAISPVAVEAAPPRKYVQVHATVVAPGQHQTHATVACPPGLVPLGGGAFVADSHLNGNLHSSFPLSNGWAADVNQVSSDPTILTVHAVCARQPKRYVQVASAPILDPAGSQAAGFATCPANTVVLGGGSESDTSSLAANLNDSFPSGNGWRADMNMNTTFAATFTVFAICSKAPTGYAVVTGAPVANPQLSRTLASADCAAGAKPLGGGATSASGSVTVDLNSTFPTSTGWGVFEDNAMPFTPTSLRAMVVCAG